METGKFSIIENEFSDIDYLKATSDKILLRASSPTKPYSIIEYDLTTETYHTLAISSNISIDKEYISIPELIKYENSHGQEVYAFFYKPANKEYQGNLLLA